MSAFVGDNLTKYNAGGAGDNVVADGYIKTVEKVWMDSYTFSAVLTTADTLAIASIPPNKKIVGVDVFFPTAITPTTCTILVGTADDEDKFIDDGRVVGYNGASGAAIGALQTLSMNNPDGFQYVTTSTTNTTIYFKIGTVAMTAPTAGTIKTVVRYT